MGDKLIRIRKNKKLKWYYGIGMGLCQICDGVICIVGFNKLSGGFTMKFLWWHQERNCKHRVKK